MYDRKWVKKSDSIALKMLNMESIRIIKWEKILAVANFKNVLFTILLMFAYYLACENYYRMLTTQ